MIPHNHIARKVGETVQKRIDALKIGQKMQDLPEELWHESFRYYVKEDPNRVGGPNLRMIRLDPKLPSLTVTGYIFNKFVHPYENRFISVREAARLQGFPDEMKFEGSLTSTQMQVGNAVPVPLAKAVFETVLKNAALNHLPKNLKGFSTFSGAGGMDLGAFQSNYSDYTIQTLLSFDCSFDACQTLGNYLKNFHKGIVDVKSIKEIENPLQYWENKTQISEKPDIIFGGPPCQAFSQAGKQLAEIDERGTMVFEFIRLVKEIKPLYFVMENVANLRGVKGGLLYQEILSAFKELGYNVQDSLLLAADFGAPQLRRRIFLMGCQKNLGTISPPTPTHGKETFSLFQSKPFLTVGESFRGLPVIEPVFVKC